MPDSKRAERMLSLVIPTERAASIVGDLTERASNDLSFWTSIARITLSMAWKDMRTHPGDMAYVALGGAVMNVGLFLPFAIGIFFSWIALMIGAQLVNLWTPDTAPRYTDFVFALWTLSAAIPVPYMAGRWIGRRAPGREFAAATAFGLFALAPWIAAVAVFRNDIQIIDTLYGIAPSAAFLGAVIVSQYAGAIHTRHHPVAWEHWRWFEKLPFDRGFQRIGSRWRLTAPGEQKYSDIMLLLFTPFLWICSLIHFSPPLDWTTGIVAICLWTLAACFVVQAVVTRPLQWTRPGSQFVGWLGRILFVGVALALAAYLVR
jgi:hypothetical protein